MPVQKTATNTGMPLSFYSMIWSHSTANEKMNFFCAPIFLKKLQKRLVRSLHHIANSPASALWCLTKSFVLLEIQKDERHMVADVTKARNKTKIFRNGMPDRFLVSMSRSTASRGGVSDDIQNADDQQTVYLPNLSI